MCGVAAILTLPPATLYLYQLLGIQFTPHWVLFVALYEPTSRYCMDISYEIRLQPNSHYWFLRSHW